MKVVFLLTSVSAFLFSCDRNDRMFDSVNRPDRNNDISCDYGDSSRDAQHPDAQLTLRVKQAIMSDSSLSVSARFVHVTTINGVVILTGSVPTRAESQQIELKAKSVDGVRKVDNQLIIKR